MIVYNKLDIYCVVSADRQTFLGFEMTENLRDTSPLIQIGKLQLECSEMHSPGRREGKVFLGNVGGGGWVESGKQIIGLILTFMHLSSAIPDEGPREREGTL